MTRDEAIDVMKLRIDCYGELIEVLSMAIEVLSDDMISRAELFNKLSVVRTPMEANEYKAEVFRIINEM